MRIRLILHCLLANLPSLFFYFIGFSKLTLFYFSFFFSFSFFILSFDFLIFFHSWLTKSVIWRTSHLWMLLSCMKVSIIGTGRTDRQTFDAYTEKRYAQSCSANVLPRDSFSCFRVVVAVDRRRLLSLRWHVDVDSHQQARPHVRWSWRRLRPSLLCQRRYRPQRR